MSEDQVVSYVKASATLLGLPLDEAQIQRVAAHLARTVSMAQRLDDAALDVEDEPAALYCPAPFPQTQP